MYNPMFFILHFQILVVYLTFCFFLTLDPYIIIPERLINITPLDVLEVSDI